MQKNFRYFFTNFSSFGKFFIISFLCVCVYPLYFLVYFLNIEHGDILLHNHSTVINSGNSTKALLLRKYISHFFFSFIFRFNRCSSLWLFLMFPHERIPDWNTTRITMCPFSLYHHIQRLMVSTCTCWWSLNQDVAGLLYLTDTPETDK